MHVNGVITRELTTSGIFINDNDGPHLSSMKMLTFSKLLDFALGIVVAASLWVLVIVFYLVLPSIASETVDKADREVLLKVYHEATDAAFASASAAALFTISITFLLWRHRQNRVRR